ncbi:hypothetical protein J7I94_25020 [Streptomyces sp. ISL-12]|uniref:hypothetical protein n=1 Tax=Streptomyces sp. ISL-12 TaxID=2819177 RepID=UPI001BEA58C5|nr:hypothetical protein [Streptomyces sp. ISL-12]MBT2413774.1 hypothetical protein [Streptomyces sp. ISL-12]
MTDASTHLTRLRTRLLAVAYANTDVRTQCAALRTDHALAALAHHDPAASEDLAATLAPDFLDDTRILGAAAQAGHSWSTLACRSLPIRQSRTRPRRHSRVPPCPSPRV